jgi:hypothetical protein
MTHTYALCRLLEHGPLTWKQMREITGWQKGAFESTVHKCLKTRVIVRTCARGTSHYLYRRAPWN